MWIADLSLLIPTFFYSVFSCVVNVFCFAFLFSNGMTISDYAARLLYWRALLLFNILANCFLFVLADLLINVFTFWVCYGVTFLFWFVFTLLVCDGCADIFPDCLQFIKAIRILSELVGQTSSRRMGSKGHQESEREKFHGGVGVLWMTEGSRLTCPYILVCSASTCQSLVFPELLIIENQLYFNPSTKIPAGSV